MSIQNARSNTSGNAPSSLQDGQIAINQADSIVYSRNPDGTIRRFLLPKRGAVNNVAFQVRAFDTYIGVASLTASRTLTLPAAANYPAGQPLTIADESGAVTASITVGLAQASGSSDTINGASNLLFTSPYFGATLFSDGVSKWTAIGLASGGSGSALLYTPQTLTTAQQRQTLANLALSSANLRMTEIQAAASKGSYFGLVDGLADGFADSSGIDTANAQNANPSNGTVINQANDPNTLLLGHFDGINGATTTTDSSSFARAVTLTSATISTAQSQFGGASLNIATGGNANAGASASWLLFAGNYTMEAWVRPNAVSGTQTIFEIANSTSDYASVVIASTGNVGIIAQGNQVNATGATLTANTWAHVAAVRNGATTTIYVNGTSAGTITGVTYPSTGTPTLRIGGGTVYASVVGYMDEARISNVARYTANFTPATSAFSGGSSGVLILPSVNYALTAGVPTLGSIFIRAKATADVISPNTNFIASLSRNGTLGGSNSLDVTLAATAVLPDGYTNYEANNVDLTGLTSGAILKGSLRTVGTSLGVAIDGWRIRAA